MTYTITWQDYYYQIWVVEFSSKAKTRNGIIRAAAKALAVHAANKAIFRPGHTIYQVIDPATSHTEEYMFLTKDEHRQLLRLTDNYVFDLRYC